MTTIQDIAKTITLHSFGKEEDAKVYVRIQDADKVLISYYNAYFNMIGQKFHRHPSLSSIVDWLKDNKGKGLFLYGACSQGKTILARYILPAIFSDKLHKIVNYYPMVEANRQPDEVKSHKIISLDDVGTEEMFTEYGNKRHSFNEIIDAVEQQDKLAIITTNYSYDDIEQRYGTRTLERILATCIPVCFNMCKDYYTCDKAKLYDGICNEEKCDSFCIASFRR